MERVGEIDRERERERKRKRKQEGWASRSAGRIFKVSFGRDRE